MKTRTIKDVVDDTPFEVLLFDDSMFGIWFSNHPVAPRAPIHYHPSESRAFYTNINGVCMKSDCLFQCPPDLFDFILKTHELFHTGRGAWA